MNEIKEQEVRQIKLDLSTQLVNKDELTLPVRKANVFIKGKYQLSMVANRLYNILIAKAGDNMVSSVSVTEFKEICNLKGKGIYNTLRDRGLLDELVGLTICLEGIGDEYMVLPVFTAIHYSNGTINAAFSKLSKPFLKNLTSDYSSPNGYTICRLKSRYTSRLYELLYVFAFLLKKQEKVSIKYDIGKLRAEIGTFDVKEKKLRQAKEKGADWNTIAEMAVDSEYYEWRDFKKRVLDSSKKAMDESSETEFVFDYEAFGAGRGGKYKTIIFTIYRNPKYVGSFYNKSRKTSKPVGDIYINELDRIKILFRKKKINLDNDEYISILSAADNNTEVVTKALDYVLTQKHIDNLVGFLIATINGKWYESEKCEILQGKSPMETQEFRKAYEEYLEESKDIRNSTSNEDNLREDGQHDVTEAFNMIRQQIMNASDPDIVVEGSFMENDEELDIESYEQIELVVE